MKLKNHNIGVHTHGLCLLALAFSVSCGSQASKEEGAIISEDVKVAGMKEQAKLANEELHSSGAASNQLMQLAGASSSNQTAEVRVNQTQNQNWSFSDIQEDIRANEIQEAADRGLVSGFPGGLFRPQITMTREQLAAILFNSFRSFGMKAPSPSQSVSFSDVSVNRWSYKAIDALNQLGIVTGMPNGKFEPANSVTRAQAATMLIGLVRLARKAPGKSVILPAIVPQRVYADTEGHWAETFIKELSGYCHADNAREVELATYKPDGVSTRSHATGMLMRALMCYQTGALPPWAVAGEPVESNNDVLEICETSNPARRQELIRDLANLDFGSRRVASSADLSADPETCVLELLPSAMYVNLLTGVPAGTLIGQAIQETGWCRSRLAKAGRNFHGQKAKFRANHFDFWNGEFVWINSTESETGEGNLQRSKFMSFEHPDHSFYSVAERFILPGLPYNKCMPLRTNTNAFIQCIGKSWAVHKGYADIVMGHRSKFRSSERPKLRLDKCEIKPEEWQLKPRFR